MEDFLGFTRFLWKISQLDLIFEHEKLKNLDSKFLKLKKYFFFLIILNIIFINYIFSTLLTKSPVDAKYLGECLYNCSLLVITVIEILILYFNREELNEILRKLPHEFLSEDVEKFNLKSIILRTKIFYTMIGAICAVTSIYYQIQNLFTGKLSIEFKFPFDISNPVVYYAINVDLVVVLQFASFFIFICPIFKFGLIIVTAAEFLRLKEEFKDLMKKVRRDEELSY
jgi:hypothetical protein